MDFFGGLSFWGTGWTGWVIPFLFVLSIVVFFHELGHFLVARWCGIRVLTFSVGFGPELAGFYDRHGTRWKISAIPLGGYVKFFGDESAASTPDQAALAAMSEEERRVSFFHKPVVQRVAVVAAGPLANFVLATAIFAGMFMVFGKITTSARVETVQADSAAASAGFQPGDLVVAIDGRAIESFDDMKRIVATSASRPLDIEVDRGGSRVHLRAIPDLREERDRFGNRFRIGVLGIQRSVSPGDMHTEKIGPFRAVAMGAEEVWATIEHTFTYLGRLFAGRESADQIGGVIQIARVSGQMASLGFEFVIRLAGILSVSIGLLNLFPIPLLDGGHLMFYAIEAIRGRPLSERAQELGFRIGLAIVLMLMTLATYNDILKLVS